jgi:hypothetical protein
MIQFPVYSLVSIGFGVELFETSEAAARFLAHEKLSLKPDAFAPSSEAAILDALRASTRRVNVFYPVNAPDFAYRCERHDYFASR